MKKQISLIITLVTILISCLLLTGCDLFHTHEFAEWTIAKQPTCTEDGIQVRFCSCGEQQVISASATGHSYDSVVTNSTCWDKGFTTHTCHVCGDSFVDKYVDELGHTYANGICIVCGFGTPSEGLYYTLSEDETSYVVSGIGTCSDVYLVIPSTYNGKPVTQIARSAFNSCTQLRAVLIPESVVYIGKYAFYRCSSLMSIIFEAPANWYRLQVEGASSSVIGTAVNLNVPANNAEYFTDRYVDWYWQVK